MARDLKAFAKAYIQKHMPAHLREPLPKLDLVDPEFAIPTPRVTLNTFKRRKNNQAEEKAVKSYILSNMGDFDVRKREYSAQDKERMAIFVLCNAKHFAISLMVRILLEARGDFDKTNIQVFNIAAKIRRWVRLYEKEGREGLELKRGKVPGQHDCKKKFNLDLIKEAILALGSSGGRHSYSAYYRYYLELERAQNPDFKAHYTKFVDWAKKIIAGDKQLQIYLKKGKDGLLQRYPVGIKPKEYVNAEWQVDSTKMDFMVKIKDPRAKKGYRLARKTLSAVIDCYSGSAYAQLIESPNSKEQVQVLFNAMARMGVPDKVRHDNGSDYASQHYQDFLRLNHISSVRTLAYEGRAKGKIERFFGVLHSMLEWLPGYLGHNVAKRQQIESQWASKKDTLSGAKTRLPESELLFEEELALILEDTLLKHFDSYRAHAPLVPSVQELAQIRAHLGKQHHRTIRAFGVELDNKTYTSAAMWDKCSIGDSVIVRENIDDPQEVSLFSPSMRFICKATSTDLGARCMDLQGFRKAKKSYVQGQLSPFLSSIKQAQHKISTHRASKVQKILSQALTKKTKTSPPPQEKPLSANEAIARLRKAAGYD